jgi:hypothetical protein
MKKTYIISGIIALTVLVTSAGVISTVLAASSRPTGFLGRFMGKQHQVLTDAQKADLKTKMDAVKAALDAGSYTAWVAAEKALDPNSPTLTKVTADNFSTFLQDYKDREAKMAAQKTKIDAVTAAITAGNYTDWVTAEKANNDNSPLLTKITTDNFSQYVQANNLQKQADDIFTKLGIGKGDEIGGFGHGMSGGFGRGGRGGSGGPDGQSANSTGSTGTDN